MSQGHDPVPGDSDAGKPWWRHGIMWLVVGGPLTVVVAATLTAVVAIRGADLIVDDAGAAKGGANTPAMKARNHAAQPADH